MKLTIQTIGKKSFNYGRTFLGYKVTENNINGALKLFSKPVLAKVLNRHLRALCMDICLDQIEIDGSVNKQKLLTDLQISLRPTKQQLLKFKREHYLQMKQRREVRQKQFSIKDQAIAKLTAEERAALGIG